MPSKLAKKINGFTPRLWSRTLRAVKYCPKSAGFTIIEVLVSLSIIVVLSIVSLTNFHSYKSKGDLSMAAHKLVSDIRQVQANALSLKEFNGSSPAGGWGIRFNNGNDHYMIFADFDNNHCCDSNCAPSSNELVRDVYFPTGVTITKVTRDAGNAGNIHVTYEPPDPIGWVCPNPAQCNYSWSEITLGDGNSQVVLKVNIFGLVDVNN